MKRLTVLAAILTATLTACGGNEPAANQTANAAATPKAEPAAAPKTELEVKQQQVQQTFEEAMAAIPPELREKHQAAFNCVIERNNKLPQAQQKQIGPETVREITQQLQANPSGTVCG